MKRKMRVSGIDLDGTKKYVSWASHKGDIFINLNKSPSAYKDLTANEFVQLQFLAQRHNLKDIKWELESNQQAKNNVHSHILHISKTRSRVEASGAIWR